MAHSGSRKESGKVLWDLSPPPLQVTVLNADFLEANKIIWFYVVVLVPFFNSVV